MLLRHTTAPAGTHETRHGVCNLAPALTSASHLAKLPGVRYVSWRYWHFRYKKWLFQREMARPLPAPRTVKHRGPLRRTWDHVRHPYLALKHWQQRREAAAPVPPPMTEAELAGGPIRRTYVGFRMWLSRTRRHFTSWPIVMQLVGCLVAAAMLVGVVFGAKSLIGRSQSANANAYLAVARDMQNEIAVNKHAMRALVAGDYTVLALANASNRVYQQGGFQGLITSLYGCSLLTDPAIVQGKKVAPTDLCKNWPALYRDNVRFYAPDVGMLMTGSGEAQPRVVNGKTLTPGEPAFAAYLDTTLDLARSVLAGGNRPFVIATTLCERTALGAPIPGRAEVDAGFRHYAATHSNVTIADLTAFACPGGRSGKTTDGKDIMAKGTLTKAGATAVWQFLADAARAAKASSTK